MEEEIFRKVCETLSAALGIESDDIRLESSLVRDLGAESIDFIDILFRLEKVFDLKIPAQELFPGALLSDERYVQNGKVTDAGIKELRAKVPYLDVDGFSKNPQVARIGDYFTVQMIVHYLRDRVVNKSNA